MTASGTTYRRIILSRNVRGKGHVVALVCALAVTACGGGQADANGSATASSGAAGGGGGAQQSGGSTPDGTLVLPREVLGDGRPSAPVSAQAELTVDAGQLAAVSQLRFTCHRCGFFGAPEFESTTEPAAKIKASMRLLGGVAESAASA